MCLSIEQRVYHQSLLLAIGVIIGPFQALGVSHIGPFQAIQLAATQTNVRGHRPFLCSPVVLTPSAPFALLGKLHITNNVPPELLASTRRMGSAYCQDPYYCTIFYRLNTTR